MKRFYSRRTRLVAAVMLGVLLAGGFWATPSLRAFAQSVIDYFVPTSSDTQQHTQQLSAPLEDGARTSRELTTGSLDDLMAQAEFAVALPGFIPAGYTLDAAYYQPDDHRAFIHYTCARRLGIALIEQQSDSPTEPQKVGASAQIIEVPLAMRWVSTFAAGGRLIWISLLPMRRTGRTPCRKSGRTKATGRT